MSLSVIDYMVQLVWWYRLNQSNVITYQAQALGFYYDVKFEKIISKWNVLTSTIEGTYNLESIKSAPVPW